MRRTVLTRRGRGEACRRARGATGPRRISTSARRARCGRRLRMLDDLVPDVAVVDIGLPDGSGLDVLRRLRCGADRLDSGTPVLVLTARTEEADVLRAFERGADDYLRKPFALPELIARVHALLARGRRVHADIRVGRSAARARGAARELGRAASCRCPAASTTSCSSSRAIPARCARRPTCCARCGACRPRLRTRTVDSHASRLRRKLVAAGAPTRSDRERVGAGLPPRSRSCALAAAPRPAARGTPLDRRRARGRASRWPRSGLLVVARVHDRVAREGRASLVRTLDAASPALQQRTSPAGARARGWPGSKAGRRAETRHSSRPRASGSGVRSRHASPRGPCGGAARARREPCVRSTSSAICC